MFISINDSNRINGWSLYSQDNFIEISELDLPEDFDSNYINYLCVDGEFTYDEFMPEPQPEPEPTIEEKYNELAEKYELMAEVLDSVLMDTL